MRISATIATPVFRLSPRTVRRVLCNLSPHGPNCRHRSCDSEPPLLDALESCFSSGTVPTCRALPRVHCPHLRRKFRAGIRKLQLRALRLRSVRLGAADRMRKKCCRLCTPISSPTPQQFFRLCKFAPARTASLIVFLHLFVIVCAGLLLSSRPEQAAFSCARFVRAACGADGPWQPSQPQHDRTDESTQPNSYRPSLPTRVIIPAHRHGPPDRPSRRRFHQHRRHFPRRARQPLSRL